MQVLEKILEEINLLDIIYDVDNGGCLLRQEDVEEIIRKHMNDGWIPVDERLPVEGEDVLVTTDVGLITFGCLLNGKWITDQEPDYPIAWQPLPEPYQPERSKGE